jgi:hypothetical protein
LDHLDIKKNMLFRFWKIDFYFSLSISQYFRINQLNNSTITIFCRHRRKSMILDVLVRRSSSHTTNKKMRHHKNQPCHDLIELMQIESRHKINEPIVMTTIS